jgi:purine nucleosidase
MVLPVLIDTDPGIDDAMAILFALCSPELEVRGITTGFGNADVETTTRNARQILDLADRGDIPLAMGAARSLARPFPGPVVIAHGNNGLGNVDLPPPVTPVASVPAAWFIVQQVLAAPSEITIVTLGRLTNLALALLLEPRIAGLVRQVVTMGGAAFCGGNASAVAESNINGDPEAARTVTEAGWPMTMVGLDVTTQTVMDDSYLAALFAHANRFTRFIDGITQWYRRFFREHEGIAGFPVHDSSAIAYAIRPELFRAQRYYVTVETQGQCRGMTVVERRRSAQHPPNLEVCVGVDAPALLALYLQRLTGTGIPAV